MFAQPQVLRDFVKPRGAHQVRLQFREPAFRRRSVAAHQAIADHETQNRVAQKLQLFVVAGGLAVGAISRRSATCASARAPAVFLSRNVCPNAFSRTERSGPIFSYVADRHTLSTEIVIFAPLFLAAFMASRALFLSTNGSSWLDSAGITARSSRVLHRACRCRYRRPPGESNMVGSVSSGVHGLLEFGDRDIVLLALAAIIPRSRCASPSLSFLFASHLRRGPGHSASARWTGVQRVLGHFSALMSFSSLSRSFSRVVGPARPKSAALLDSPWGRPPERSA